MDLEYSKLNRTSRPGKSTLAACDIAQSKCMENVCELCDLSRALLAFRRGIPLRVFSRIQEVTGHLR